MKDTLCDTLAAVTPWEYLDDPGSTPTIATNTTVAHLQQANNTYVKACQIFEKATNMNKGIKHQIIETIE